nr:copper chaperone PCu(A)C [Aeromicrobium wangtongii]
MASACGSDTPSETATQASAVSVKDPWVKAADQGMTAAFATLRNAGGNEARVVSAAVESVTQTAELHEMAADDSGQMVMRQKPDGIVLPAGRSHELRPGGDHIMLIGLTKPVRAGDEVRVTLTFADRSELSFTAPARSFSGAQEDYQPDGGHGSDPDPSSHHE